MTAQNRRIYKSQATSRGEVSELLQGIFAAELLAPSPRFWIVSPWISDIPVLDSRTGAFSGLDPAWGRRQIRLAEVLVRMMSLGAEVVIATRPVQTNSHFLQKLKDQAGLLAVEKRLTIVEREELHTKGILGDGYYLAGSMNLTWNGVEVLDESVIFSTDATVLGEAQLAFRENYGGRQWTT